MKYFEANIKYVTVGFAAVLVMLSSGCTKTIHDRRSRTTQTPESRESFGFNLNGRYFKSEERTRNVAGSCTYKEKHNSGSTFRIQANHSRPDCISNSIEIVLDSVELKEGNLYKFGSPGSGKNYLKCSLVEECSGQVIQFTSNDDTFGYIEIKRFNPDKNVVAGNFSCIGTNEFGVAFQIADGYFDRHFTR